MRLILKNLFRRLRGMPPVTDVYFDESLHRPTSEAWSSVATHNREAILITIEKPKNNQEQAKVKCYAKISNSSILIPILPSILSQFSDSRSDGET